MPHLRGQGDCERFPDRLDIGLLKRAFLGWLRGEEKHCSMAAIPTLEEEDAKRPTREREQLVGKRTGIVNRMKALVPFSEAARPNGCANLRADCFATSHFVKPRDPTPAPTFERVTSRALKWNWVLRQR